METADRSNKVVDFRLYRAQELYEEGVWLEKMGENEVAVKHYLYSAALDTCNTRGYISAGLLFDQMNDTEQAKTCYLKAIERGKEPLAYYCLGYIQEKEGDIDSAIQSYENSVKQISDFAEGYIGLGDVFLRKGEYQISQKYYEKALLIEPFNLLIHVKRNAIKRYREFEDPFPLCKPPAPKVQVYAERRAINLGIDYDDGINIPRYFFHNFSYHSLAVVIKRFQWFCEFCLWDFTKIMSGDDLSFPLVLSISEILGVPVSNGNDIFPKDRILLVNGVGDYSGSANNKVLILRQRGINFITLFFAVRPGIFFNFEPNIIGVYSRASLPWFRTDDFSRYHVMEMNGEDANFFLDHEFIDERNPELIAGNILNEFSDAEQDTNNPEQINWYFQAHQDLNFDPFQCA
ncbi:MAG: hypothetical protein A2161_11635 [Candidatus Schekmanbacteria bacterium RBG_13_48_7]|uniref:Uncharacterized protein n=1 Tax=Candidatus Schekmanbacteria bacterium RBG_13_48_7 TaxID=1817878 RepID=A0A1F7S0P9_9BACT|nr:MAG: hypothetical protein A2161_11635 [Candidatus Schekmanbacteria bacterium RBG_13_48_7]